MHLLIVSDNLTSMTKSIIQEKISKTAGEMKKLVDRSKRKLLELEVLLSSREISDGDFNVFGSANELIKKSR